MPCPVSVIIPCYRCAESIDRAVESVATQTLVPEEILLVEDCSNDGGSTLAALHRLQQRYRDTLSINVIALGQNGGPGRARNVGWDAARQPYIAFLDADDSWHPRKLEIQYQWMHAHPAISLTGHQSVKIAPDAEIPDWTGEVIARPVARRQFLLSNCIPTRSVMLRRGDVKYRFDPAKRHSEDYLLWLRIILSGHAACRIEAPLAFSYKADYGEAGLSGDLWKMEKGELNTYREIYRDGLITMVPFVGLVVYSLLKYLRRIVLSLSRTRTSP